MADAFGTAIFTDCAPGQGLSGSGGMQFQSRSPGVGGYALDLIRRHLIYETPQRLIIEREPVEAFPPSFAHAYDKMFATAAGVYLGREAGGYRQGNHLTHAIVTTDARTYRSVRPAQLFGAPFWRTEPAATADSEELAAPWQPGPFNAGEACRFVGAQRDGLALLTALLAALLAILDRDGTSHARRVLFISEQPGPVLSWLAAATLLIPQQQALKIGFKVFTADPARSALPVVAMHPKWSRSTATVEDDYGYAVFDLIRHEWTAVTEPPEARYWARLFCEADPYDVIEAVELAAASGLTGEAALDLAAAAVLGRTPPPASTRTLVSWLRTGPPALCEAYGGTLIDALAQLGDLDMLGGIEAIIQEKYPSRRDEMQLALLRLELEHARQGGGSYRPGYRGQIMSATAEDKAAQLVAKSLRGAREEVFNAVLRVADRFGISVSLDAVHKAAAAFVAYWADHPEEDFDPGRWPADPPVHDMLRDELSARLVRTPTSAPMIADQWWDRLWRWKPDQADVALPLHRALLSAAMLHSDDPNRLHIVKANLTRRAAPVPGGHYRKVVAALWARTPATAAELGVLCKLVPPDADLAVKDGSELHYNLVAALADELGDPVELASLELYTKLSQRGVPLDEAAAKLMAEHGWLCRLESHPYDVTRLPPEAEIRLLSIQPALLAAHAEPLAGCLLTIEDPTRVARLVDRLPGPVVDAYLREVPRHWERPLMPSQIAVLFAIRCRPDDWWAAREAGSTHRYRLEDVLTSWCRVMPEASVGDVARLLDPLGADLARDWNRWSHSQRRRTDWRR